MRLILWVVIGLCSMISINYSYAAKLSSYPSTSTFQNGDNIPAVITSGDTNANINWYSFKELISNNINWTDVKTFSIKNFGGDHTGINWQGLGA